MLHLSIYIYTFLVTVTIYVSKMTNKKSLQQQIFVFSHFLYLTYQFLSAMRTIYFVSPI